MTSDGCHLSDYIEGGMTVNWIELATNLSSYAVIGTVWNVFRCCYFSEEYFPAGWVGKVNIFDYLNINEFYIYIREICAYVSTKPL